MAPTTVAGEQSYESISGEWRTARWSVAVDNELANPAGQTVAHARGTMLVQSRAVDDVPYTPSGSPSVKP